MARWSDLPLMKHIDKAQSTAGSQGGYYTTYKPLLYTFIFLNVAFLFISPSQTFRNYEFLLFFAPLWLPYLVGTAAFTRFVQYRRALFLQKQKYVLLELRLPRDTRKTPLAMETFFSNMHFGPGESNWYKRWINGGIRPWWSFEIASIGGQVHFYLWTREAFRRSIESYLYSQYPDMEIIEAEDYSRLIDPSDSDHSLFGEEFVKTKEDPFPIKTYVAYGLDKPGSKPEEQVDPIAQVIELLGSIGPKEQFWIQFIIRQSKKEKFDNEKDWKEIGQDMVKKIRDETRQKSKFTDPVTGKVTESDGFPNPTKGQLEGMAAIEANTNKPGFDTGIRVIYSAPKDAYQGIMANFILSLFKPFSNEAGNGFKQTGMYSAGFQDYPWEDPKRLAHDFVEHKIVDLYRRRAYFNQPYVGPWSIFSSEELATLYHIPSASVLTPGLPRMQSATSGAPANLPT